VIAPASAAVTAGGTQAFTASAGAGGPYTWAMNLSPSGGSITASGLYTAGAKGNVTDYVKLTDSAGAVAIAAVTVAVAPLPPLQSSASKGCGCGQEGASALGLLPLLPLVPRRRRVAR
jgi:hypothetical protein